MIGILKYLSVWQLAKYQDHIVMSTSDFSESLKKAHNRGYKQGRAEAFDEFVAKYKEFQNTPCDVTCDVICDAPSCDGECIKCFEIWYKEQKNETT